MAMERARTWPYKVALLAAAAVWGLSTVVIKDTVDALPPLWIVGIRFTVSSIPVLAVAWWRRGRGTAEEVASRRATLRHEVAVSLFIGLLLFASYVFNAFGLFYTTAAKNAFLTATYCVFTPFVAWAVSRLKPSRFNVAAAIVCVIGIGLIALEGADGLALTLGDSVSLGSAAFFAIHIAFVGKYGNSIDVLFSTGIQFLTAGLLGIASGLALDGPPSPAVLFSPDVFFNIAYVTIFASCISMVLQNVGISKLEPTSAALLLSLESVFGVIFSVLLLGEALTLQMVGGFVLVFIAILISELLPTLSLKIR